MNYYLLIRHACPGQLFRPLNDFLSLMQQAAAQKKSVGGNLGNIGDIR
jgi:hypothetical protein